MAVIMHFCWCCPVGLLRNTTPEDQAIRGFLVFRFLWVYLLLTSTSVHLAVVAIDLPETAGIVAGLPWMVSIPFCGIGVRRTDLPGFWTFVHRAAAFKNAPGHPERSPVCIGIDCGLTAAFYRIWPFWPWSGDF